MTHKIFLVSGATDGIGRVTATELARTGGEVIVVGRDRAKAERVVAKIKRDSENEQVSFEVADLSLQSDLHALASRLNDRLVNDFPTTIRLTTRCSVALLFFSTNQDGRCEFSARTAAIGGVGSGRSGGSSMSRVGIIPGRRSANFVAF